MSGDSISVTPRKESLPIGLSLGEVIGYIDGRECAFIGKVWAAGSSLDRNLRGI